MKHPVLSVNVMVSALSLVISDVNFQDHPEVKRGKTVRIGKGEDPGDISITLR